MELTLENKIDLIFGKPLKRDLLVLEAEVQDPEDLGLDKRLGVTRSWRDFRHLLKFLTDTRDRAKAAGMHNEWANINKEILGPERSAAISNKNPVTYEEAMRLARALRVTGFMDKLDEAEYESKRFIDRPQKLDPETAKAVEELEKEANIAARHSKKSLSLDKLINPRKIDLTQPMVIRYKDADGYRKKWVLDNSSTAAENLKQLVKILSRTNHNDLLKKLKRGIQNRVAVLREFKPSMSDSARYYHAVIYTIRNIADELNMREE